MRFALVTKTYAGDLPAFDDLCRSIDTHMPSAHHYVLVDHGDYEAFQHRAGAHRTIVNVQTLLPRLRQINILGKRVWWGGRTSLIRGWIYQQLAKIAFVAQMTEDAAVHLDSDVCLLKPIEPAQVFGNGRVFMLRSADGGQTGRHFKWHRLAQRDLGLPVTGYQGYDYIGPATIWSTAVVRAMIRHLEAINRRGWVHTLARHWRFSEYLHYGIFSDQVKGEHQHLVTHRQTGDCHVCWGYDLQSSSGRDQFVADLGAFHHSVLIQSNLKLPEAVRSHLLQRLREKAALMAEAAI